MPVLLVRHAHALARSDWDGDDEARELSVKGHQQARLLAPVLSGLRPGRVISSPAKRCVDTVQLVADAVGRPVERDAVLAEGAGRAALPLMRALAGDSPVLCSHGDVIPELLNALVAEDGLDLGADPKVEKGSVWVLEPDPRSDGPFLTASYLPPLSGR